MIYSWSLAEAAAALLSNCC